MLKLSLLAALVALAGCASKADRMINLEMGMTRAQVMDVMGSPTSVSSINNREYLSFNLCTASCLGPIPFRQFRPFYVRLTAGKVESFGEKGDFDSTKTLTTRIEIDKTVRGTVDTASRAEQDMFSELRKLKELFDAKIITQEEFDIRKKLILSR